MQLVTPLSVETPFFGRIPVVDVLRAFALFGIIINHSAFAFLAGAPPDPQFNTFSSFDKIVGDAVNLLTFGKFFSIFSFLFGLSFAIQLENANRKGTSFSGRFIWRLIILLAIGFVHNMFFSGDILVIYAILGLFLVPSRKMKNRTLIIVAVILILNIPGVLLGVLQLSVPTPTPEQQLAAEESGKQFAQMAQEQYNIKQTGTLGDVIRMNMVGALLMKLLFQIVTGRLWITYGLFLLGLYAGRINLFQDSETNRSIFSRMLLWTGIVSVASSILSIIYPSPFMVSSAADVVGGFVFSVQQASVAAFFVAAVTLLYWRAPTTGLLPQLAPLGKMGLTTYLMQSVFGLIVFYGFGFGMLGKLGIAACVGISILFFVVQIIFSLLWMKAFQLGPVEWLWRSLTYLKLQPLVKSKESAV